MIKHGVLVGVIALSTVASHAAVLTGNGAPLCTIVVPDQPGEAARDAAGLLQETLRKISDAAIPIQRESAVTARPSVEHPWVAVGDTRLARSCGIDPQELAPEEIRVLATREYIVVTGCEGPADASGKLRQQGPYFAALELLERLGVRWLWPGEEGEVIPRMPTLELKDLDYRHTPRLVQRHLRFISGKDSGEGKFGLRIKDLNVQSANWGRKMRLGQSLTIVAGHSWGDWYQKYFRAHPEYFAVGEDGKTFGWMNNTERAKLCVSNPGTLRQMLANIREYYRGCAVPRLAFHSLSPTDNQSGHCMCAGCRAMDALDGRRMTWNFNPPSGNRQVIHHVSLTDRYVKFWNRVAEALGRDCPGLRFGAYAYGVYRDPPLHVEVHPNIVIGYVGGSYTNETVRRAALKHWDGWAAKTRMLFFRPNLMKEGQGFPLLWPVRMAEDLAHFTDAHMIGVDIANIHGHWGTQGLNYYVLARKLWDPAADPQQIIDDYCEKGFAPAAAEIRAYLLRLVALTDQLAAQNGRRETDVDAVLAREEAAAEDRLAKMATDDKAPSAWETVYTPQAMAELDGCLQRAAEQAQDNPAVMRRVRFLQEGFEYARLDLALKQQLAQYVRDAKNESRLIQLFRALVELDQWRTGHAASRAVGVVAGNAAFGQQLRDAGLRRLKPVALATANDKGGCDLTALAYSADQRITKMQLSNDGKNWSPPQPYAINTAWRGQGLPYVRFYLESTGAGQWTAAVQAVRHEGRPNNQGSVLE